MDEHHILHNPSLLRTFSSIFTIIFFLTVLPQYSLCEEQDSKYSICSKPFHCEGLVPNNLSYPFWEPNNRPRYCGGSDQFKLNCDDPPHHHPSILLNSQLFNLLFVNKTTYIMRIVRPDDLNYEPCNSERLTDFSLESNQLQYTQTVHNITIFYDCPSKLSYSGIGNITCQHEQNQYHNTTAFYGEEIQFEKYPGLRDCLHPVQVHASRDIPDGGAGIDDLENALEYGFEVNYTTAIDEDCKRCLESKGICGRTDSDYYQFACHCPLGSKPDSSSRCHTSDHGWNWDRKVIVGVASAVFTLLVCVAFYFYHRKKKNHYAMPYKQSRSTSFDSSLKDTEKGSQIFGVGVPLFTYSELEEATNYFDPSKELGDGGFGTVYYGKLRDGRGVAVKRLYENNCRRVEQFMNEVNILTGLRHPNLVSLYGCTSRHSRELLLVYEYIPNGTVADHLHGEQAKPATLPWHIRMKIAVETASALKYLHAQEIIHRDVKTNNILLDEHFCVKVADFGLSRLFPTHVTHISTAPQGTPGYVDPEYHECYQLTYKSDVYSFGVVLIELISSLPAVDITRHRHEINLANMAINKIHSKALHELVDQTLGFDSDQTVRKMIDAVAELAFQCLQNSKEMRPSMEEVLDTLKDIQSDGKYRSQPEVLDIIGGDDIVLLKDNPPPPSPDSNVERSISTTPSSSG